MNKTLPLIILLIVIASCALRAQTFTNLNNGFPTMGSASVAWADYDNDSDLDFAVIGFSGVTAELSSIYRNDGGGVFTLVDTLPVKVSDGSVNWGDYDHDGDLDLLVNGQNGGGGPVAITTLFRNDGNSVFTEMPAALAGSIGVARWIDYDGDGWLDVVMCGLGVTLTGDSTRLFHNDTNGTFTEIPSNLPGFQASDISVVDFDNDGDMDFFILGGTLSTTTFPVSKLFANDGNGNFTEVPFPFMQLSTGTSKWADYDHDGDMDLLYDGIDSTASFGFTLIYRNDSAGNFTLLNDSLPGSGEPGSVDWADIDNDGDLDILLGGPSTLLRNDGNNVYTDITPVDFPQAAPNSFADIDNDGAPDILFISQSGGFTASTIFRNDNVAAVAEMKNSNDFKIYPNPTSGKLFIGRKNFSDEQHLVITDCTGRTVKEDFHFTGESVDMQQFTNGIYFICCTRNKNYSVARFVMNNNQ